MKPAHGGLRIYAKTTTPILRQALRQAQGPLSTGIWLCGGVNVNHHTLSDFYTAHGEWLDKQFTLHLASLKQQGLVDFERVAQDGMRVRANAGAASFRRGETLEKCLEEAEAYIEKLARDREANPLEVDKRKRAAQERAARERRERIAEALRQLPEAMP